jgi:hypothetical protein
MQKHVRRGIIYKKIKTEVTAWCWRFDTESKLVVLSNLFGKILLFEFEDDRQNLALLIASGRMIV